MTGWILYILVCLLWSIFTLRMNKSLHPLKSTLWYIFFGGFLNFVFCPISLVLAVVKFKKLYVKYKKDMKISCLQDLMERLKNEIRDAKK